LATSPDVAAIFALYHIARRLPLAFDPSRLEADLERMDQGWWGAHQGPYHDGAWESVSLWAPRGDLHEQRSTGGEFAATEALERCSYIPQVLDAFPSEKNRVRFMRLKSGGRILRHSDPIERISRDLLRVHVPVRTSADVHFLVNDLEIVMRPGEVWHVDVRFPHEVHNAGVTDRVHLVIDLIGNPATEALLDKAESMGRGRLTQYFASQGAGLRPRT
jgi:hypothetical protein